MQLHRAHSPTSAPLRRASISARVATVPIPGDGDDGCACDSGGRDGLVCRMDANEADLDRLCRELGYGR